MKNNCWKITLLVISIISWFSVFNCQPYPVVNSGINSNGRNQSKNSGIKLSGRNNPSKARSLSASKLPEYQIAVGDIIEVKFFYQEDLNEIVTVRPDGRITLQRVNSIYVLGMTPSHLQKIISLKYSEIIKEPEVTVFIRKYSDLRVYVMGEVQTPGGLDWQQNLTLVRAVAEAGGFKKEAKVTSILLLRLVNNRIYAHRLNLRDLFKGSKLPRDVRLKPNDVVFIPSKFITNVKEFVTNFYDLILPPLDVYYRATLLDRIN